MGCPVDLEGLGALEGWEELGEGLALELAR